MDSLVLSQLSTLPSYANCSRREEGGRGKRKRKREKGGEKE